MPILIYMKNILFDVTNKCKFNLSLITLFVFVFILMEESQVNLPFYFYFNKFQFYKDRLNYIFFYLTNRI